MVNAKSLLIGKYLFNILTECENINKYVGNRVFPIVAESGTKNPFIIYVKNNITPEFTKDGLHKDFVSMNIHCISNTYLESCEIANEVRNLLDYSSFKSDDINISQIKLDGVTEGYDDNLYVQTLTFTIQIK